MKYDDLIQRLFATERLCEGATSLEVAHAFHALLDCPASSYPTIHIAGSNGKGSVALKIAKALELSGYKVGLYTSPHLFSPCERIMVDSVAIEKEELGEILQLCFEISDQMPLALKPAFFELITVAAFAYFQRKRVDVAVIETGLGGRLDATNLIHPVLSVITSISREHVTLLGEELESIATEKAGIIKEKVPVVLGPKARVQPIYDRAACMQSPVFVSKKISDFFDEENSAVALLSLEHLASNFTFRAEVIAAGLAVRPPCRFERIGGALFDVAHNPEAIFSLLQALYSFFPHRAFRFLVGFSKDKEYARCLELIADVATHIHLVQADSPRAAPVEALKLAVCGEDPHLFSPHLSVQEGVSIAYMEALANDELLVVTGSFYIMAEAIEAVLNLEKIGQYR